MPTKAEEIINACENNFEANKSDCNAFAKAVATVFGVTLTGNANAIVDQIQGAGWTVLANGIDAKAKADAGFLVIAGIKGADYTPPRSNGHVAVVVLGPLVNVKHPTGYWGQLGGVGKKNTGLNYSFNAASFDDVVFSYIAV